MAINSRNDKRKKRHFRVRRKIVGTSLKPRLSVFRSSKNTYAQIIDDTSGNTLVSVSTREADFKEAASACEASYQVGEKLAKLAQERGLTKVVFDRSGYKYHGRVKQLAEGARKGGLDF